MHYSRFLFLLFVSVSIFTCKEEEVSVVSYPSLYHKSGMLSTGSLRVFSLAGEIKTSSVISRFLQYDTSYYNYNIKILKDNGIIDTIRFIDAQHAKLDYMDFTLRTESDLLILTERYDTQECCFYGEAFTRSLLYNIGKVKRHVSSEFINSSTGGFYYFGFNAPRQFLLTRSQGKLIAPAIHFMLHSAKLGSSGFLNNVLKPDFYKTLEAGDTVSLIESQISFEILM